MEDNLRAMYGQPIEVAYQVLGIPDGAFDMRGMKVYVWSNTQEYSYSTPVPTNVYDAVLGASVLYNQRERGVAVCKIKVVANSRGMIVQTDYSGGLIACEKYADRMDAAFGR